jgi:ribosomal protein L7/L12
MQVRCGSCNALNFYSEKSEVLLCEECNREISISLDDDRAPKRIAYARRDDDKLYELVLLSNGGHKTEELISALQHMLALNRNQVKQMLDELPVTLLSGIPRMKAEMLQTQLTANDAVAEFKAIN